MSRRAVHRAQKRRQLLDQSNIDMASEIIKNQQIPMEFKLPKGYRDALAHEIIVALAKKNT